MNPAPDVVQQRIGGRFGPRKPPEPPAIPEAPAKLPSAADTLAALAVQRRANGGLLVPPPPGINSAAVVFPGHDQGGDGSPAPSKALRAVEAWFRAIVDAGGAPQDLQRAWEAWTPTALGEANPRPRTEVLLDRLKVEAGRRHAALIAQADVRARLTRELHGLRTEMRGAQIALNEASATRDAAQREVDRLQAAIAKIEGKL